MNERQRAAKARLGAFLDQLDEQTRRPGEPPLREAVASQARERLAEIPYMLEDTAEEFQRVRDLAWPAPPTDDQREQDRQRLGVTCACLGPPYYVCPHWPARP